MAAVPKRSFKNFSTRRQVVEKVVDRRLGFNSPNPPTGWKWDYRYMVEDKIPEALPFPGLKNSHLLGLPRSYWQNGPVEGRSGKSLKIEEVKEVFARGQVQWSPVIHNGDINIWRDSSYFFSDDSVVETIDASSVDTAGHTIHTLDKTLRTTSPVMVNIFRRDNSGEYIPWRSYNKRALFTGLLDSAGDELITRSGDIFYWSNVDTTKREFVSYVRDEFVTLLFNKHIAENITKLDAPVALHDFNDLEYAGDSDGTDSQIFKSEYFPVSNDSYLKIYVINRTSISWDEYTIVDTFTGTKQCKFDFDLGIVTFGAGANALPVDRNVYFAYRAVPRVEYEEEGFTDVSLVVNTDLSPLGQSMNRGFITLARSELDIESIELTTTKSSYPGKADTYGPVYVGSDFASLIATVFSSSNEIVPNSEVTFSVTTSPSFGGLGGGLSSIQRRTGFDGKARTFYVPPVSVDSMGYSVSTVNNDNVLILPTDAQFTNVDDIYTYYVLKDDPFVGIAGADPGKGEVEWDPVLLNGRKVIVYKWNSLATNPISGYLGAYTPVRPTSISNGNALTYPDDLELPDINSKGTLSDTVTIASSTKSKSITNGSWATDVWRDHVAYSASLSEFRRIKSNDADTLTLHGEWSDIPSGNILLYDKADNLGSYWVVSDRFISIRASVYSPNLARTIYSDPIKLQIAIPEYMKGSYISNSIDEIPFGWRVVDDTYAQASAINGATYISINPVAGPYPIVDVISGETWEDYEIGPNDGAYPFWPYDGYPDGGVTAPFAQFSLSWNII